MFRSTKINRSFARSSGFTLIEMVVVSAIIGLLVAIAVPKFSNLIERAREAVSKGKLGAMRSSLAIYYADVGSGFNFLVVGPNPSGSFWRTMVPKYYHPTRMIRYMDVNGPFYPELIYSPHGNSLALSNGTAPCAPPPPARTGSEGGGWVFKWCGTNTDTMIVFVGCQHDDSNGNPVRDW